MLADHFHGKQEAAYESALRPFIISVAHMRHYSISIEYKLPKTSIGRGSHPKIDAMLNYGKQALAFEVKTIRRSKQKLILTDDIEKLKSLANLIEHDNFSDYRFSAWQIVAWDSYAYKKDDVKHTREKGVQSIKKELMKNGIEASTIEDITRPANLRRPICIGQMIIVGGNVNATFAYCAAICIIAPERTKRNKYSIKP